MVAFGTRCICKRNRVCRRCIPSQPWMSALGSRRTCKRRRVCRRSIPSQPWMIAFGSCIILVSHQYHKRGEACRWETERLKPRVRHALTSNRGRCSRGARNQLLRPNASAQASASQKASLATCPFRVRPAHIILLRASHTGEAWTAYACPHPPHAARRRNMPSSSMGTSNVDDGHAGAESSVQRSGQRVQPESSGATNLLSVRASIMRSPLRSFACAPDTSLIIFVAALFVTACDITAKRDLRRDLRTSSTPRE
jgi:hypothetical protein